MRIHKTPYRRGFSKRVVGGASPERIELGGARWRKSPKGVKAKDSGPVEREGEEDTPSRRGAKGGDGGRGECGFDNNPPEKSNEGWAELRQWEVSNGEGEQNTKASSRGV